MGNERTCNHGALADLSACIVALEDAYRAAWAASDSDGAPNTMGVCDKIAAVEHDVFAIMGKLIAASPLVTKE